MNVTNSAFSRTAEVITNNRVVTVLPIFGDVAKQ